MTEERYKHPGDDLLILMAVRLARKHQNHEFADSLEAEFRDLGKEHCDSSYQRLLADACLPLCIELEQSGSLPALLTHPVHGSTQH